MVKIYRFITSPIKIIGFCVVVFLAWVLGNKLNKDLEYIEERVHNKENKDEENQNDDYIDIKKEVR